MSTSDQASEVFVVYGALRSGSTLLRLILDAHPQISCHGERDFLLDYIDGEGADAQLDHARLEKDRIFKASGLTLPRSFSAGAAFAELVAQDAALAGKTVHVLILHRGLERLQQVLPDARIIHLIRDPRDVARSSIGMGWAGNTWYGVDHWSRTETDWDAHSSFCDNTLTFLYEKLLEDPQTELNRICAFMGLEFDEAMFAYTETSTYSALDPELAYQWRRKQTPDEIADVEAKVGALLTQCGYTAAAPLPRYPGVARRSALFLQDKISKLSFRRKRYGMRDTLLSLAANKLRWPALGAKAKERMREKVIQNLK